MKEIIRQIKNDILNGDELRYDYTIKGVDVTVLMDDFPWVRIIADGIEWETYVGNEHYDGKPLDTVLDELNDFIISDDIKHTVKAALKDKFCVKGGVDCYVTASDNGAKTTIQYQGGANRVIQYQDDKIVTVTVDNQDLIDDEDGIITKVAEFFANF